MGNTQSAGKIIASSKKPTLEAIGNMVVKGGSKIVNAVGKHPYIAAGVVLVIVVGGICIYFYKKISSGNSREE